jgi:hypothetical protein
MKIRYTRKTKLWFKKIDIDAHKLSNIIVQLCAREGKCKRKAHMTINIMSRALDSSFTYINNRLDVAVGAKANKPRHYKIKKMIRNLLHELRHFIQYRIKNKPFNLSYTMRDANLMSDRYWNDPEEIDARHYERKMLMTVYKKLIKR